MFPYCSSLCHRSRQINWRVTHVVQLRHLRLQWVFLPVCVLRCLSVSRISALDGYFLTDEHSHFGPADSASSHLISTTAGPAGFGKSVLTSQLLYLQKNKTIHAPQREAHKFKSAQGSQRRNHIIYRTQMPTAPRRDVIHAVLRTSEISPGSFLRPGSWCPSRVAAKGLNNPDKAAKATASDKLRSSVATRRHRRCSRRQQRRSPVGVAKPGWRTDQTSWVVQDSLGVATMNT